MTSSQYKYSVLCDIFNKDAHVHSAVVLLAIKVAAMSGSGVPCFFRHRRRCDLLSGRATGSKRTSVTSEDDRPVEVACVS